MWEMQYSGLHFASLLSNWYGEQKEKISDLKDFNIEIWFWAIFWASPLTPPNTHAQSVLKKVKPNLHFIGQIWNPWKHFFWPVMGILKVSF